MAKLRGLLLATLLLSVTRAGLSEDGSCTPEDCKLPNCFCSGTAIPGGLQASQIPQMVMLTFDDSVGGQVWQFYEKLIPSVKNQNGCPMGATFFVSHDYTNYYEVQLLSHWRQEIADHTITHREPTTWWKTANATEWTEELGGQRTILNKFGGVPVDLVRGVRAPFLQIGGDTEFGVVDKLGFQYESSMPTNQNNPPMWPYTLDYPITQECVVPPCPTQPYPGLWEVPLVDLVDKKGTRYSMVDAYIPTSEDDAYDFLESNFLRHYNSNRAPFGLFMHAAWFLKYPNMTFPAMQRLFTKLQTMPDVWIVTVSQAISWIKEPQTLDKIKDFQPWQCSSPVLPVCEKTAANTCNYNEEGKLVSVEKGAHQSAKVRQVRSAFDYHTMVTCASCPPHYPWVGNPDGN